jgi:tetratricopeptide (TPR) repeat protein
LAQASNILGILAHRSNDDLEISLAYLTRSLEIAETLHAPSPRIAALNNLALIHADLGQLDLAINLTQRALDLCVRLGDRHRQAALHNNLADFYHLSAEGEKAMDHLKQAVSIFAEIGANAAQEAIELRSNPEIWMLTEW